MRSSWKKWKYHLGDYIFIIINALHGYRCHNDVLLQKANGSPQLAHRLYVPMRIHNRILSLDLSRRRAACHLLAQARKSLSDHDNYPFLEH
jgi:hypothetical protein